jgi:thiol:disulfide interchange protein DsbD
MNEIKGWPLAPAGLLLAAILLLCSVSATAAFGTAGGSKFLKPDQAFSHQAHATDDGRIKIQWHIADGYYLYRSRLKIKGAPAAVANVDKPEGKTHDDPYFGKQQIYQHDTSVTVTPGQAQQLKLTWQGCAKAGLCYPPQHTTLDIAQIDGVNAQSGPTPPAAVSASSPDATASSSARADLGADQALAARLAEGSIAWTLLAFFGFGLLLSLTPCVLPMVPILSGVVVGSGARGTRGLFLSLAFVLPMAATYAVLGVAAALAGANLQAVLQTPAVLGAFAAVFIVLAASMFGLFELQLPAFLRDRLSQASANRQGGHLGGAAALGVISAVLVGPCMTAPLAGALLYIANTGNALLGGLALLCLGLGMGVPLLIVGTAGAQLLPKPGPWMNAVKAVFGFILLATAIWLISRVTPPALVIGLWGALLVAIAVTLGAVARRATQAASTGPVIAATLAVLCGLWGGLMIVGASGGADNPMRPLAFLHAGASASSQSAAADDANAHFTTIHDVAGLDAAVHKASQNGQWTVVDFYADWCVSCKVIDKTVFGNTKVQKALDDAQLLRPDVTDSDAQSRNLLHKFGILGPPTILFISPDGQEQRSARVVGELSATDFLDHWQSARHSGGKS